ncbi:heme-binding protein [Alphaproteobacteria bacterium]|nr:heme-binding protein [Alphaproteobacteria bacterium]
MQQSMWIDKMVNPAMMFYLYISLLTFVGCVLITKPAMSYEEPKYTVIKKTDIYEVRLYEARTVAQVVYGKEDSGFKVLFNYISGENDTSSEVTMTVPVTQSEKIDMTAPVAQSKRVSKMVMQFFLPKQYSLQNAPEPNDPRINIIDLPETYFAVISYSGSTSDKNFNEHHKQLKAALDKDKLTVIGVPLKATYNSPFTLPFLRRNEAMYLLANDGEK